MFSFFVFRKRVFKKSVVDFNRVSMGYKYEVVHPLCFVPLSSVIMGKTKEHLIQNRQMVVDLQKCGNRYKRH